ncbi:hypothetical protein DPQ33_16040 [Oceanidesulfovibrio indonesiensis]|uniref:Sulfotransferase domain-containing protein n=1 Tax=Oceanidesulfovibrio indonesiensis TaxID=54767 RepID=A0A7M3MBT6_9BACT|nr:sulfotransferase domain-containing protein [Oceanidesulfovibrio indonesiensis]TVM15202.1 hypothetical protein DPQ33_16040 [Oceanidesulfovibrio indonesiensis]
MASQPRQFIFELEDGSTLPMDLPEPADYESSHVFSMHKSGSSLLTNMIQSYCARINMPVINMEEFLFQKGVPPNTVTNSIDELMNLRGYVFAGSRAFWHFQCPNFPRAARKIILVRDPRDVQVSSYFSFRKSHVLPAAGKQRERILKARQRFKDDSPDEYITRPNGMKFYKNSYGILMRFLDMENSRGYRYEDVIFYKYNWLKDMVQFLGLEVNEAAIDAIAKANDIRPKEERPDEHVRQVSPGNYWRHLSQETIDYLNETFAEEMKRFGYDTVPIIR